MNKYVFPTWPSTRSSLLAAALCAGVPWLAACDAEGGSDEDDMQMGASGAASGGSTAQGGTPGSGGSTSATGGSSSSSGASSLGTGKMSGSGNNVTDRYAKAPVARDNTSYLFMANGWGPGFQSQTVSWSGTGFTVVSMEGTAGPQFQPASYPTVFCGVYSDSKSGECGLPKLTSAVSSLRTGWRWKPNGNTGEYNAAYDIWLSSTTAVSGHSSYLMVWLRDPPGQQPAGSRTQMALSVANVPGPWDLWVGTVGGKPCISYVRREGTDLLELEFDAMDFVRDAAMRGVSLPGTHILSVAVGFEIWRGPVKNLVSEDFYVDAR